MHILLSKENVVVTLKRTFIYFISILFSSRLSCFPFSLRKEVIRNTYIRTLLFLASAFTALCQKQNKNWCVTGYRLVNFAQMNKRNNNSNSNNCKPKKIEKKKKQIEMNRNETTQIETCRKCCMYTVFFRSVTLRPLHNSLDTLYSAAASSSSSMKVLSNS